MLANKNTMIHVCKNEELHVCENETLRSCKYNSYTRRHIMTINIFIIQEDV